jgi:hypothetical protein
MKYRVPVRYEFDGTVEVYADTPEEAQAVAADAGREMLIEMAENGEISASDIEVFDIE